MGCGLVCKRKWTDLLGILGQDGTNYVRRNKDAVFSADIVGVTVL